MILALPLSAEVKSISKPAVAAMAKDVQYLVNFVETLDNSLILMQNLDELQQTVQLMMLDNHDEYYDAGIRNRKFGRVDPQNGPILLAKYVICLWNT